MSKLALKDLTGGLEEGEGPLAGRNESVCGVLPTLLCDYNASKSSFSRDLNASKRVPQWADVDKKQTKKFSKKKQKKRKKKKTTK